MDFTSERELYLEMKLILCVLNMDKVSKALHVCQKAKKFRKVPPPPEFFSGAQFGANGVSTGQEIMLPGYHK